ncbi:MAG: quinone oxidoreductase [Chloroflexi bacterium]|nr:quinone oxidoreductase [Chloroflexota bacterium]MCL5273397.1 quinone oxidoreductase [Chloroflexota bacterium]
MRAIRVHEFGDASKLSVDEVAVPEPQAGQVRVKVAATGLNFVEVYHRKGQYPNALPMTLGAEFAGAVDAVGEGVTDFQPGDRVGTANGAGGYAEYAIAPAAKLLHVPEAITLEQAAAVLLQGMTAHYLALSTYPLKPGDTALMHAAAGGVGHLLVQIGRKRGARIIATVSTDEKAQLARMAGADEVILYSQVDFEAEVKRLTAGRGVEVVYDSVGKTTFAKSLNCLKPRGMLALYGQASGPVEPINLQILNQKGSLFVTRPTLAHYVLTREELEWRAGDLFNWMTSGELIVRVDRTFPLARAADAQTYMEARGTRGKVLLIP